MALKILTLLAIVIYNVAATPTPVTRNTIFIDEKLQGQIFEGIDSVITNVRSEDPSDWRLPTTTKPVHYDVALNINIQQLSFTGTVNIQLVANQANVSEIVLHAQYYDITSLTLQQGTTTLATTYEVVPVSDFLQVRLTNDVLQYNAATPITYVLSISFGASLRTEMNGLYRSWFRNSPTDEVSWMATTHFQATGARYAFPCYDEPSFKATFAFTVTRPSNYRSWFCTRLSQTTNATEAGYEVDVFSRTPIMSTYLLALIVTEYESVSILENQQLKFEVIARPAAISSNQAEYAFDVAQKLTSQMGEHTGIDFYGMDENLKMTHAAIPDFSAGAMENWGLMVYREAYLMYDPNHTNDFFKQLIAYILSHEIAHMWFGNLVTCEYWDNLWLNEGFARYYQYFLTDWVEDYMGFQTRFITEQMHTALLTDSANSPLPLTYPQLTTPASVRANMFSLITYNKGAAFIRMTEHLLGSSVHRQGLQYYLTNRAYSVARPIDLFESLQLAATQAQALDAYGAFDFIEYCRSWSEHAGHPVLNVNVNRANNQIVITQSRFNINMGVSNLNTTYIVPLTFTTASNPDFTNTKPTHIMSTEVLVVETPLSSNDWVIFNKQQTGFYRVNYDDESWNIITNALKVNPSQIHEYNRAQIVNDVFQFARSGLMSYTKALSILSYLENEKDYAPWVAAITGFQWLRNRFAVSSLLGYLDELIVRWATPLMNDLTYYPVDNEDFMGSYLRYQLAPFMCEMNVAACRTAARQQFLALVNDNTEVPPNSRNWVYCNGLRDGSQSDFDFLWSRYNSHNVYTEKIQLLQIFGCSPHSAALNTFLSNIVEDNFVIRPQDYTAAFTSAVNGNEVNTQIVLEFIKNNMAATEAAFSGLAAPLSNVAARLRSEEELAEFEAWLLANQAVLGDAYATALSSAQSVRNSMAWVKENEEEFYNFFLENDIITPDDAPDSAVTSTMSIFAVMVAFATDHRSFSTAGTLVAKLKMATLTYFFVLLAIVFVNAGPRTPVKTTIFADEKLDGEVFENIDAFTDVLPSNIPASDYRLPTTTSPVHYTVLWAVDIQQLTFSGTVDIDLVATQANVNEIVIHSASYLNRTSTVLTLGATAIPVTVVEQPELDFIRIQLSAGTLQFNPATPVVYKLSISFAAPLRTNMYGIYQSWYRNNSTATAVSWMASTQYQATSARYAFPCYDEPKFKATFDVTISRPVGFKSWFLTKLATTRAGATGYEEDVYTQTPKMSTYLLALIVAEYESVPLNNTDGTLKYEVIARPGAINAGQADYAFTVGQLLTDTMSNHTGIDYYGVNSNLKMTHASIPDFSAGAMENWGLITYREAYLMYDPNHTSDYFKQLIAYILSHEIAHMWFGNLVTNEFWDCLWLNEGFARYYQYFLTDWVEDYMGLDTRFITEQVHTSLLSDSADDAHPLTNPDIGSPTSISDMFSTISYNKGAAVIRMTEHLLGFEVHRQGLQNYLTNRYLDTAVPNDLFQALQTVAVSTGAIAAYGSDFSVVDYYRSWTEKAGHPVLYVEVNHQTGDMTIQQRRFNINTGYSTDNSLWIVPVTFATASNPDFENTKPSHIIRDAVTVINRGTVGDEWVIFNKQQTGFYRVNYDEYTWNLIVLALRGEDRTKIHEYNRAQIVDDVFQFARSGILSYTRAFSILSFLENETEYAPWVAAMTGFTWLRNRLAGTSDLALLEQIIARWATPIMNQLTYEPIQNESFMRSYLRWQLAPVMCAINVRACRDAANTQFRALVDSNTEVDINSRNWVYCNGLREGSEADFDFLWQRYQQHNVYTEKIQILQFIGCTPYVSRINSHLLNIVQDNFLIRPQDYTAAFNSLLTGNEANTLLVFAFVRENLPAVINAFGTATTPLSNIAARLRTLNDVTEFLQFVDANQNLISNASYERIVYNAELTRQSIVWTTQVRDDMNNYFVNGDDDITASTAAPVSDPPIVSPPDLVEPETPDIPGSAVTAFVSVFAVVFAAVANFAL
ncbi:membrane alanyl aminopeptidase-like [Aricia agestis]|uniref:membrane alanyl aminopeptidase-like n=1 Tax=Aricia agestis TaxID=91739 RepID=UPI001C209372|nr:membrane alanyl aminopeptidase-like [Aricia agestis]